MSLNSIDHIMCLSEEPRVARSVFECLGFVVTPYSEIAAVGGGNQCVLFRSPDGGCANYLELLSIEDEAQMSDTMGPILAGYKGPKMLVLGVPDIKPEVAARTSEGGVAVGPLYIDRDWVVSKEEILKVSFGVYIPTKPEHSFPINACQHFTLEHYQRLDWTSHPNGACHIRSVLVITDDQDRLAAQLLALGSDWHVDNNAMVLSSRGMSVVSMSPDTALRRLGFEARQTMDTQIVGVSIVADLLQLERWLNDQKVPWQQIDGRIVVAPLQAQGIVLEFIAA